MALPPQHRAARSKPRRRGSGSFVVSVTAALVAVGGFATLGFAYTTLKWHDQPHKFGVHRRVLHADSAAGGGGGGKEEGSGQQQGSDAADQSADGDVNIILPGLRHTLVVLTTKGVANSPAFTARELRAFAQDALQPVAVSWYTPAESAGLATLFGATVLPAVAYLRPHCLPATCEAPPVLELVTAASVQAGANVTGPAGTRPTTAADVVSWVVRSSVRPSIHLANDHPTAHFQFRHVRDMTRPEFGDPLGKFDLKPGQRHWIETPLGAQWVVTQITNVSTDTPPPVVKTHKIVGDTILVVRPDECNIIGDPDCKLPVPPQPFTDEQVRIRQKNIDKNLNDIISQKKSTPIYTKNGFEKTRAPPLLYAMLKDYWDLHNTTYIDEQWPLENTYVNHEASRFLLVDLPGTGTAKPTLFEMIRPTFERWADIGPQEPSAIYGIRIYTEGSSLIDHVDRPDTHIISAIINVAQDVDEPWPLEIIGHSMKVSHVTMQPGDMVLYEGASCAHGRPTPLKGRFMANVFLHMRPTAAAVHAHKARKAITQ
mmetsp:Transcript_3198/g.9260  ORF Transcript_3198/g.9260 Transcript_3198/m.9260 type:complete len:542 (-) Transcript_3198:1506-3131(-)